MHKFKLILTTLIFINSALCIYGQNESVWTSPLRLCWTFPTDSLTGRKIASDNESTVFILKKGGIIEAIDTLGGDRKWKTETGGEFGSDPEFFGQRLYVMTRAAESLPNLNIRIINPLTGIVETNITTGLSGEAGLFELGDRLYAVSESGRIEVFDRQGDLVWRKEFDFSIKSGLSEIEDLIVFGSSNKTLVFIRKDDGSIVSQINLRSIPTELRANGNLLIYSGDAEGNIYKISLDTKETVWRSRTGGEISGLDTARENLLVSSDDNYIYMLSHNDGGRIWKRKTGGRIIGKSMLDDNHAVFLSYGSGAALVLDLRTGKTVNVLDFENRAYFTNSPQLSGKKLILPTNLGLYAYDPTCQNERESLF
jgi:outer membrane protein assembly factor BamB